MARRRKKTGLYGLIVILAVVLLCLGVLALLPKHTPKPSAPEISTEKPTVLEENPYNPQDFVWDDGFLTCIAGEAIQGIDVSYYQEDIDWQAVKAAGIEFAMIRLGYRGSTDGLLHEDVKAQQNLTGAREAGLQVGAYFFSQALNAQEAREEAAFAIDILGDYKLDFPLAYDWEYMDPDVRTGKMTDAALLECVNSFCSAVEAAGYSPMVYFNRELSRTLLDLEKVNYPFWFAQYSDGLDFPYRVKFWQYSDCGTVPGIEGDVDLDLYFP